MEEAGVELGQKKKPKKLGQKKAPKKLGEKKGPKPPKKEDGEISLDSGDEETVKKEMEKRGLKLEDLEGLDSEDVDAIMEEAGVELGQKKKPKKLGQKKGPKKLGEKKGPKPPKKGEDGEISLDSGDEEMVKKEMEKRGLKLEDLEDLDSEDVDGIMKEAGVELGEKKGPKPPKKGEDGEISLDSGDEELVKKEMEK